MSLWFTRLVIKLRKRKKKADQNEGLLQGEAAEEYGTTTNNEGYINTISTDSSQCTEGKGGKPSKLRWYIVLVFSLFTLTQGGVWNTWGPIYGSAHNAFGWQQSDIALLTNWGPITYLISAYFFAWVMDVKGLRWAVVISMGLVTIGTGLRCITSSSPWVSWLMHIGQALNGFGGPVAMSAPPVISAAWFPVEQRTTSTAMTTMANGLGVAIFFIIGPQLVRQCGSGNITHCSNSSHSNSTNQTGNPTVDDIRSDIMYYMYYIFIWCAVLFLIILVKFPSKPAQPPSLTAGIERVDFKKALPKLFRHGQFWMLALPYGIANGVYNCWGSVLDVNLKPTGVHQDTAGWLGFYGTICSVFSSVIIARFADFFSRRMKVFLLVSFTGALLFFLWFSLLCQKVIPFQLWQVFASFIMASIMMQAAVPLFYELVCETTYPIAEGVTNTLLTTLNNLAGLIFLLVLMIPNIGTVWMNWTLVGCIFGCIPVLCLIRERYSRLGIDTHIDSIDVNVDS